jgi:beta-glucanase (GH16 family)
MLCVLHIWDNSGRGKNRVADHITPVASGSLYEDFHRYGVDVAKDWLTFYLDGRETWRVPTPPELTKPLMVLVNLALGSGWPIDQTRNPSIMEIDYVHVYERDPAGRRQNCG